MRLSKCTLTQPASKCTLSHSQLSTRSTGARVRDRPGWGACLCCLLWVLPSPAQSPAFVGFRESNGSAWERKIPSGDEAPRCLCRALRRARAGDDEQGSARHLHSPASPRLPRGQRTTAAAARERHAKQRTDADTARRGTRQPTRHKAEPRHKHEQNLRQAAHAQPHPRNSRHAPRRGPHRLGPRCRQRKATSALDAVSARTAAGPVAALCAAVCRAAGAR